MHSDSDLYVMPLGVPKRIKYSIVNRYCLAHKNPKDYKNPLAVEPMLVNHSLTILIVPLTFPHPGMCILV